MVQALCPVMGRLKSSHWKLTGGQYRFCSRLFSLYRVRTGHEFDKRLRGWLFFNQKTRLHAADFLAFLSLFDICSDNRGMTCGEQCPDYKVGMSVFEIINNRSDYSPIKQVSSDDSYSSEPPVVHGEALRLLRFLDSLRV